MSSSITDDEIAGWLRSSSLAIDIDPGDFDIPFSELGVDSLSLFEVIEIVEAKASIVISDEDFEQLTCIAGIGDFLRNRTDL